MAPRRRIGRDSADGVVSVESSQRDAMFARSYFGGRMAASEQLAAAKAAKYTGD